MARRTKRQEVLFEVINSASSVPKGYREEGDHAEINDDDEFRSTDTN